MAFAKRSGFDNHPFFRPKDYVTAFAAIIEPISYRENVKGKYGPQTFVDVRLAIFQTAEQLSSGEPAVAGTYTIGGGAMAEEMKDYIDEQRFVKIIEVPTDKGRPAVVPRDINDPAQVEAALKYLEKRKAAEDAAFDDLLGE